AAVGKRFTYKQPAISVWQGLLWCGRHFPCADIIRLPPAVDRLRVQLVSVAQHGIVTMITSDIADSDRLTFDHEVAIRRAAVRFSGLRRDDDTVRRQYDAHDRPVTTLIRLDEKAAGHLHRA